MTCTWPVDRTCLPDANAPTDRVGMQAAVDAAVEVLWSLTGRQFGCCPVIVRPRPQVPTDGVQITGGYAVLDAGVWRNVVCGGTATVIDLPGPVCDVVEVTLGGEVLPTTDYQLEGTRLYRLGDAQWPEQDMNLPLGEPGTWSVTYEQGSPPPAGAGKMVGILALEFWNACSTGKCKLPRRVQTVSRQGVTYQKVDPTDIYEKGATGLSEVDLWVSAVNPHRHRQAPAVSSPDWPRGM